MGVGVEGEEEAGGGEEDLRHQIQQVGADCS